MTLAKIFRAQMVCRRAYTYGTQCKYVDYNGVWEIRVVSYCLNYYQLLSLDTVPIGKYKKPIHNSSILYGIWKKNPCSPCGLSKTAQDWKFMLEMCLKKYLCVFF